MLETSTKDSDNVERRCVIIKPDGEMEETLVQIADKEAVANVIGGEAEFKGELEGQRIAILGAKNVDGMDVNDLGFTLVPDNGPLKGVLLAFALGENGKPIDLNITRFRRSKKNLRKRQNATPKEKEEKEESPKAEEDTESLEVYVQGMPYETTEDNVRSFFAECGEIQEVRLSYYHDSGKCRGYGFVRFSSPEEVTLALQKDKEHMGTRYVNVSLPHKRETTIRNNNVVVPLDCKSIFVKNLPYEADEESVKGVFMRFGKISSVRIPRHMDTGRQKGICYVEYMNGQSVKQAVAMSGILEMQGRKLMIDVETGKPKNSFRSSDGRLWSHVQKRSGSQNNRGKKQKLELCVC